MPIANVHRISAASPEDVSGIEAAIAAGRIDPKGIVAIFGKTEGNGLVNDLQSSVIVEKAVRYAPRGIAIDASTVNAREQPLFESIAQFAEMGRCFGHVAAREFAGFA